MPRSKAQTIWHWKRSGLIYDNYDELYEAYIKTSDCQHCKTEFTKKINDVWITATKLVCLEKLFVIGAIRVIVILNIQMDIQNKIEKNALLNTKKIPRTKPRIYTKIQKSKNGM